MNVNYKIQSGDGEQNIKKGQQRQIRFVEEDVKTLYSSIFNIGFGHEEVMFVFANQTFDPNVVRIESKVAMSQKTAKRLAITLSDLIRRYEAQHGKIDISTSSQSAPELDAADRVRPPAKNEEVKKTH